jgi:microcystin-dependent protein
MTVSKNRSEGAATVRGPRQKSALSKYVHQNLLYPVTRTRYLDRIGRAVRFRTRRNWMEWVAMSELFMGTIVIWPIGYAPDGTIFCQGQKLDVSQYQALFSLLSVTFGGDGRVNFNLPDLRARIPIGTGAGTYFSPPPPVQLGQTVGASLATGFVTSNGSIALTTANLPAHTHPATFAATTANVPVNISVTGSQSVNIPVGATVPTTTTPATLSGPQYLSNYQAGIQPSKGGFVSSLPASTVNLAGVNLAGGAGVTASPTVNMVTGGSVTVANNTGGGTPVPVQVAGQFAGSNLQPSLGLNFLMTTVGIYPVRP